jgi:hypothetical protein
MEAAAQTKTVPPLLRKDQVEDMQDELRAAEQKIRSPNFLGDKSAVAEQLNSLRHQLERQAPKPYGSDEIDAALKREAELRGQWTQGMLSQEEMRKCPPGAVDRHRSWEKKNMARIEEWQNIQRRLNADNEDRESASIEMFRPTQSTMNMHNALIPGKQFYLGPADAGLPVTFSNDQLAVLRTLNPQLADMLGSLSNVDRAKVKDTIGGIGLSAEPKKAKRTLSPEHKAAMLAGRKAKKA